jgi:8-oxo-dGTP pyrophosphatase MutT (NUDIX family)
MGEYPSSRIPRARRPEDVVPLPSAHVAAVVLLRDDDAVLMQLRDDKPGLTHANMWVMPGGHKRSGEPIEACARREFEEETGYRCDSLQPLVSIVDPTYDPPLNWVTVFWTEYDGIQSFTCGEGQAITFMERAQAEHHAVPVFLIDVWDLALEARVLQHSEPKRPSHA